MLEAKMFFLCVCAHKLLRVATSSHVFSSFILMQKNCTHNEIEKHLISGLTPISEYKM